MANLVLPHYRTDSQICESPKVEIPLTKGYVALVDECDADLADAKWRVQLQGGGPYAMRSVRRSNVLMHREILARIIGRSLKPNEFCDHIDGDGLNNRRANLRVASTTQNGYNRKISRNNKAGYKGVYFDKWTGRWAAEIQVSGKRLKLGRYDTPELAHAAYVEAAKAWHGEYANDGTKPLVDEVQP